MIHTDIAADTLKKWGCGNWSEEERQTLADIVNHLGLVEPQSGVWPELADAFRTYLS